MGKKGSWFSSIKRVFTSHSKEKLGNQESEKRSSKEKKKGLGKLKRGETNSFIPLFKEPSSIEKILGDAEREQQKISFSPPTPPELPKTSPFATPRVSSPRSPSPRVGSPKVASPRAASPKVVHHHNEIRYRPEPTLRNHNASATKIQAAYRGYMARRSFRALRGLVRLQGVVRGQNVKRQTMNAMKQMQLLVRVQTQIHSRRIQMLENQARRQAQYKNDKEMESTFGKWSQASEAGNNEDWDDCVLTKEEIEGRLQRKVEAVVKRERAMAYAYSHQLWKGTPKSSEAAVMDIRSGGFPWWWNWIERQLPLSNPPPETPVIKKFQPTPPRQISERKSSPQPESSNHKNQQLGFDNSDAATPKSSRSTVPASAKQPRTPSSARIPPANSTRLSKYFKAKYQNADSPFDLSMKDDDSLISCPPFSVPSYMAPTVSAKAKVRPNSYYPKERFPGTPSSSDSKRRVSFPLTQGAGSFKWNKGSSQMMLDKNQSLQSIGNLSVDSTVSLPAGIGRKPFNRFV